MILPSSNVKIIYLAFTSGKARFNLAFFVILAYNGFIYIKFYNSKTLKKAGYYILSFCLHWYIMSLAKIKVII